MNKFSKAVSADTPGGSRIHQPLPWESLEVYNPTIETLNIPMDKIAEISIIVSGNAKLWDVGISEKKHWWQ
ncbi:hypothetical protein Back11_38610 [Paenibacillus baekrokdamisoli]|uniref:Uncharacterized protein n=1 Tax=Paenibacillus baekrokdamisoli TaxID=1712516 RepID=A0A3G9IVL5_9BACL|nr:hypothetical protein [Paenibacillus baekrokdamisoli]MBB3068439.1 hypothetical protein [Paenibacillus baekrokdamisoli]BBH22516.1 hypothetical protein Back11_38610 [Paenibacillus baekrokdamisoli]